MTGVQTCALPIYRIVGMKGEELVDYPVDEALEMTKSIDPVLVDVCNTISI